MQNLIVKWGLIIYLIGFLVFGIYRQFIIPERFNYSASIAWVGALQWPKLVLAHTAYYLKGEEIYDE